MAQDLSHLSDDELAKIASGSSSQQPQNLASMSDDELMRIAGGPGKVVSSGMDDADKMSRGKAFQTGVEQGVSFGTRPFIKGMAGGLGAFIGQVEQDKKGEGLADKIIRGIKATPTGFQDERSSAISEQERAQQDRPGYNLAGNVGGALLTAPLTPIKGLAGALGLGAAQGAGQAIGESDSLSDAGKKIATGTLLGGLTYGAAKGIEKGIEKFGPAIKDAAGNLLEGASDKVKKGATKLASALTGVSDIDIKTYAKNADEIGQMAKASDNNVATAADEVRKKFSASIDGTRKEMNNVISTVLKDSDKKIDIGKVLSSLEDAKIGLDPDIDTKSYKEIDDMVNLIKKKEIKPTSAYGQQGLGDGEMSLKDANRLKSYLQQKATDAYRKPGEIFNLSPESAKAAKSAAAIFRDDMNVAEPAIANSNNKLSKLHDIEDLMNSNLIAEGKPESALMAAGSGGNQRNANYLKELGSLTNTDMLGYAQKLSAMRTFGKPSIFPADSTGKATARIIGGSAILAPVLGPIAPAVATVMASPLALKAAINTGKISGQGISSLIGKPIELTEKGIAEAYKLLNTPKGISAISSLINQNEGVMPRRMNVLMNRTSDKQSE